MYCIAKLCFTSGSTCILRVSVKCFSFVMDSVTNSNTLFFCLLWNCYRTPTRSHCMRRLHIVSEGIYRHACTYLFYFLPPDKLSVKKRPKCYSLKAGKGKEPLLRKPQSPRVLRGVFGLCGRAEWEPGPSGPGSRARHPSSRAGGGSSRVPQKRIGGRDLPRRRLIKTVTATGPLPPVYIFTSLQKTVNNKF